MRIALVSLICYDRLFRTQLIDHRDDPDYLDREIIANHGDPVHKICRALLGSDAGAELWYLSAYAKATKVFRHKYGHNLRRISGFALGDYLTRFLDCDSSVELLREIRHRQLTHVLLVPYLLNPLLPLDMADVLIAWCKRRGIKVFPIFGGSSINDYGPLKRTIKAHVLRSADGLLCQSRRELEIMRDQHRFPAERLHYFQNPLDLSSFHPVPRTECTRRLGLSEGSRYLLYVGRLVQAKGVHHLLRIMPKMLETEPGCRLLIVGWGPMETQLRSMVESLHLEREVSIMPAVANEELKYFYSLADAVVLPSYSEGTPNVLMEAIACGAACVATEVGGIPDLLGDGVGIMVPPRDEDELLAAIRKVLRGEFALNQERRLALMREADMATKRTELYRILASA